MEHAPIMHEKKQRMKLGTPVQGKSNSNPYPELDTIKNRK
jgi:hypothetical protein